MFLDPDARMQLHGPDGLADYELLAFLLTRGGAPGESALRTARDVLVRAGSLGALGGMGEAELIAAPGVGPARARRIRALAALGRRMAERPLPRGAVCDTPRKVYESLRGRLGKCEQERMVVVLLDARMRKLAEVEIARGSSNAVYIHPREVFRPAVRESAASVIVAHNHPSGDPEPSDEDLQLTVSLVEAGAALGIAVLDHLVVADGGFRSLAELGLVGGLGTGWRRGPSPLAARSPSGRGAPFSYRSGAPAPGRPRAALPDRSGTAPLSEDSPRCPRTPGAGA